MDSLDWKDLSAEDITKRVTAKVQPGSIVLFHNATKNTPEALPSIIKYLLQEGYIFIPISEITQKGSTPSTIPADSVWRNKRDASKRSSQACRNLCVIARRGASS